MNNRVIWHDGDKATTKPLVAHTAHTLLTDDDTSAFPPLPSRNPVAKGKKGLTGN